MKPDPLIDEIRTTRRKISAEFGHDPRRLVAHYMEMDRRMRAAGTHRIVDAPATEEIETVVHDKPRNP